MFFFLTSTSYQKQPLLSSVFFQKFFHKFVQGTKKFNRIILPVLAVNHPPFLLEPNIHPIPIRIEEISGEFIKAPVHFRKMKFLKELQLFKGKDIVISIFIAFIGKQSTNCPRTCKLKCLVKGIIFKPKSLTNKFRRAIIVAINRRDIIHFGEIESDGGPSSHISLLGLLVLRIWRSASFPLDKYRIRKIPVVVKQKTGKFLKSFGFNNSHIMLFDYVLKSIFIVYLKSFIKMP